MTKIKAMIWKYLFTFHLIYRVRSSYPDEKGYVDQRQTELHKLWKALKDRSDERKKDLDAAQDRQQFSDEAKDLVRTYFW